MDDLISRQAALEEIQGFYPPKVPNESEAEAINRVGWECAINCIEAYLRTVKPVDPVKHGKWLNTSTDIPKLLMNVCSECGFQYPSAIRPRFNYCPNCGSKNGGEG